MIIHRDEDDLGVARGLYMDFKKKLGDIIDVSIYLVLLFLVLIMLYFVKYLKAQKYPGRKVTCSGSKCSPPLVGCTIMNADEKMKYMDPVWDKTRYDFT